MSHPSRAEPDNTAERVALWRALHLEADAPPHVFHDTLGLMLLAPDPQWRDRDDMSAFTRPFRASIVARSRFVEDMVEAEARRGLDQYVILGAGLDTFAQRRPDLASRLTVFEVDRPGPQQYKRRRLSELHLDIPPYLRLVPVDFEAGDVWWERLASQGFNPQAKTLVSSMGVSMYLTREASEGTMQRIAALTTGSLLVMSFMLPIEMTEPDIRPGVLAAAAGAEKNHTPWVSFFTPSDMLALAARAGFKELEHVSADDLNQRYFADRSDGLRLALNSEELLIAKT